MSQTTTDARYSDLLAEIRAYEGRIAPGSETALWGDFLDAMRRLLACSPFDAEGEATVPAVEAAWWRAAYARYEVEHEGVEDLAEFYDSITV